MTSEIEAAAHIPLCVDLDGTLLRSDTLHESFLLLAKQSPWLLPLLPFWMISGRAHLKEEITGRVMLDISSLPVHRDFFQYLKNEHALGRTLILITAANRRIAEAAASYFNIFDQAIGSTESSNLAGNNKADLLVSKFGSHNFDYAGNEPRDLQVWKVARQALVVAAKPSTLRQAQAVGNVGKVFTSHVNRFGEVSRSLRVHQWAKNLLLFIPLLGAHHWNDPAKIKAILIAFVAFCCCASSVYLLNDLLDLEADRHHPQKRNRPFASGQLPLSWGILGSPLLLFAGILLASALPLAFLLTFAVYYGLTLAYSMRLKQVAVVDVFLLAALYGIRVLAGGTAVSVPVSDWLLVFSLFLFLSLAYLKRFTEIKSVNEGKGGHVRGRGYMAGDLTVISHMGIGSGYLAVLVLALYITNPLVIQLYQRPSVLLLACPCLLYWISRTWFLAHRGTMHDDPIVFALTDRQSWFVFVALLLIGAAAIPR